MPRVSEDDFVTLNCDEAIVEAARVSYGKGTKTVNQDKDLIKISNRQQSSYKPIRNGRV